MWIVRDSDNILKLFHKKPTRVNGEKFDKDYISDSFWLEEEFGCQEIYVDYFPDLKWEDDPIEVEFKIITPFKFKLSDETKNIIEKNTGRSISEIRNTNIFKNRES